jgi:type IV secretory pathway VirB2 component (pilin)
MHTLKKIAHEAEAASAKPPETTGSRPKGHGQHQTGRRKAEERLPTLTGPSRTTGTAMSATITPEQGSSEKAPGPNGNTSTPVNPMNGRDVPQQAAAAPSTRPSPGTRQTPEGHRLIQRISLLLGQRTSFSRVMLIVLTAALIFGLIGFAVHALWVGAIVIIAIGLGYLAANSGRDRGDAVNQRQEDELDTARRG